MERERTDKSLGGRMNESWSKSRMGCAGCLTLLGLSLLIGTSLVWMNWKTILESDWYRSISEAVESFNTEMGRMLELRSHLFEEYPSHEIKVQASSHYESGESEKSIAVEFINPSFPIPPDEKESKAREIALVVASRYPDIHRYDSVRIKLTTIRGVGFTFEKNSGFVFETSDLLVSIPKATE